MENNTKYNNESFGDFEFNYAVVMHGKLSELQRIKEFLEKQHGIIIRYHTLDRGKLLIKREQED
jgi:hypothetical protein